MSVSTSYGAVLPPSCPAAFVTVTTNGLPSQMAGVHFAPLIVYRLTR